MSEQKSKGVAALLASMPVVGWAGADKYYVGDTKLGLIQTILTFFIIGMFLTIPWSWISTFLLVLAIFMGGVPYLYPEVNWAPVSNTDKALGFVAMFILLLALGANFSVSTENFIKRKKKLKKSKKRAN